jgi:dTDP-4-amino-4,6-dideoxygalactose transaminase
MKFCDVAWQYEQCKKEIDEAVHGVLSSGGYIMGEAVRGFEKQAADYCQTKFAAGVASGSDALTIALRALGVTTGDEVVLPSFTFVASAHAICRVGAKPVFVDIDPETFCISPEAIRGAITAATKAVMPVHMYGQSCEMDAIMAIARERRLAVIEDAAQAMGARYKDHHVGTIGDVGCFSFFPTKSLGACGDGGLIVTDDDELFDKVDSLRRQGFVAKNDATRLGLNSRLDALQAVILSVKLQQLDTWNAMRSTAACRYVALLREHVTVPPSGRHGEHVFHQFVICCEKRDKLKAFLAERGIPSMIHYPCPAHVQPYYTKRWIPAGLPATTWATERILSLPFYAGIPREDQEEVAGAIVEFRKQQEEFGPWRG